MPNATLELPLKHLYRWVQAGGRCKLPPDILSRVKQLGWRDGTKLAVSASITLLLCLTPQFARSSTCSENRVALQVLGSGGPELNDGRASSGYLIWINGKASILVDAGPGSSVNFGQTGARFEDLQAILFTHLHVDHSADLPAFIKGSYFTPRRRDLSVFGPDGNNLMPSTTEFVQKLFGNQGAFAYLNDYADPSIENSFHLQAVDVPLQPRDTHETVLRPDLIVTAVPVHHGPIAALAWRIDVFDCSIVFSGDMNNAYETLGGLANNADILVAHAAIPESAQGAATNLHMKPSQIGHIAANAGIRRLVISHRMLRTNQNEQALLRSIRKNFGGGVDFAEDLNRFVIE